MHQLKASVSSFFNFLTKLSTQSITKDLVHSPLVGSGNWSSMGKLGWGAGSREGERVTWGRERHEVLYLSQQLPSFSTEVQPSDSLSISPVPPRVTWPWWPRVRTGPAPRDISLRLLMGWLDIHESQPSLVSADCQLGLTECSPNSYDSKILEVGWSDSLLVDQCVKERCPLYKKICKWIYKKQLLVKYTFVNNI